MSDILIGGLVAWDLVLGVEALPAPGTKTRATRQTAHGGGGALNAARAVAQAGGRAWLAGVVGCDAAAAALRAEMARDGLRDELLIGDPALPTPQSAILVTPDGERTILNARAATLDRPPDLRALRSGALRPAAVLVDTRLPRLAEGLLAAARAAGLPGVIDAEAPLAPMAQALPLASHVAFSEQGLRDFTGAADEAALARAQARLGLWVCVTRGAGPVLSHDGRALAAHPPPVVTACNTLGAGDVWHGVFTLALGRGSPPGAAIAAASRAAAAHVARPFAGGQARPRTGN